MSNVKISQLPAASTFSPAADVAPIVHSGVTQKATLNQIVQAVLPSPGAIGSVTPNTAQFSAVTVVGASGVQKAVSGLLTDAIAGTDYAAPTTGTDILAGDGAGGFDSVSIGSGLSYSGGILSSTAGGGSVTNFAFTNGSGFTGTVTNSTTTPTLALGTSVSGVLKGNGSAISAAVSGTDYAPATSGSSILKGNGSGGFSNASSGTDYAPATSGTSILYGSGTGGFSNVTVGSGLTFVGGTLAATGGGGGSGTVTSVSVVSSNGLAGTVANATTTPAITLSTTVTGLLKGNGTAISAATAGTDYAAATTGTNAQLLANNGSGGFSNVTVGSGLTYTAGTLAATAGGGGTVTDVSVVSANGFGGSVATSTTTPAITLSTSVTGLLKGNGTGVSAATSGTDYAPATSGSSILYGNGAGGFSNVTIGTGLTFSTGTLSATGGGMVYPGAGIPNSTGSAWGTSYGTSGVNSVVLRDASGNISTNSIFQGYSVLVASGTTTTLTASSFPNWYVTGSGGQTFQLPDATTLPDGATYTFNNNQSSGVITLNNNSGSSIISGGIGSGGYVTLVLQTNVSAAGTWDYHFQTPANVSWTTNTFNYPGSFTGGTWNGSTVAVNRGGTGVTTSTGSGSVVLSTSPTLVTPILGTPQSGTLTSCTGLPISTGVSGLGSNVATFLATPSSANLAAAVTDETGSGALVFGTSPTITTGTYTGLRETKTAPSISAGTLTLVCSTGNVFAVSLNASITTLTFTNVPTTGTAYALTLSFTADGTARTVAWGAAVKWPGGTAPTLTSTNAKVDTFVLTTWDGGTTWYAFTAGQNS